MATHLRSNPVTAFASSRSYLTPRGTTPAQRVEPCPQTGQTGTRSSSARNSRSVSPDAGDAAVQTTSTMMVSNKVVGHDSRVDCSRQSQRAPLVNLMNLDTAPATAGVLTSPRSLEACRMRGIHPQELVAKTLNCFAGPGIPANITEIRYNHYETRRQQKLKELRSIRTSMIVEQHNPANDTANGAAPPSEGAHARTARDDSSHGTVPKLHMEKVNGSHHVDPTNTTALANWTYDEEAHQRELEKKTERLSNLLATAAKRQTVYEKSKALQKEKEQRFNEQQRKQQDAARRNLEQVRRRKLEDIERRRLQHQDQREEIQHANKIKEYEREVKIQDFDRKVARPIDRYGMVAAKHSYMTPERRSHSSAARLPFV